MRISYKYWNESLKEMEKIYMFEEHVEEYCKYIGTKKYGML